MTENPTGDSVREVGEKAADPLEDKLIALFRDNPAMAPFRDPRAKGVFHASIGEARTPRGLPDNYRRLNVAIWSDPPRLGECEVIVADKTGETSGKTRTIRVQRVSYGNLHDLSISESVTTTEVFEGETEGSGRREEQTNTSWEKITDDNIDYFLGVLQKEGIEPFVQQAGIATTKSTEE